MLSEIFTPQTTAKILEIACVKDENDLMGILRAYKNGWFEGTKVESKVKGLIDLYETFNICKKQMVTVTEPVIAAKELMRWSWETREHFLLVSLDVKHNIIAIDEISIGTDSEALAHPKEIYTTALKRGASRIMVAHNHPSGNCEPSDTDIQLTSQLLKASQTMGIPLLDHLIVSWGEYSSIREKADYLWKQIPQE